MDPIILMQGDAVQVMGHVVLVAIIGTTAELRYHNFTVTATHLKTRLNIELPDFNLQWLDIEHAHFVLSGKTSNVNNTYSIFHEQ